MRDALALYAFNAFMQNLETLDELRFEILRRDVRLYRLAARLDVHPSRLGRMLRGREPLSESLAARIREQIEAEEPRG
jgi:plasmid maintenance system antidote protein VapI